MNIFLRLLLYLCDLCSRKVTINGYAVCPIITWRAGLLPVLTTGYVRFGVVLAAFSMMRLGIGVILLNRKMLECARIDEVKAELMKSKQI